MATRVSRRKKSKRSTTLDPSRGLQRYVSSSASPTKDPNKLESKDNKRMAKSKSPSGYKPQLEDKIKRRGKKGSPNMRRDRSRSDAPAPPVALSVDVASGNIRPSVSRKKKAKKGTRYVSKTPGVKPVSTAMLSNDPFDIGKSPKKPSPKRRKGKKKGSMTPVISLVSKVDERSPASPDSSDEDMDGEAPAKRSQSARFSMKNVMDGDVFSSAMDAELAEASMMKLCNSKTIAEATRTLNASSAATREQINGGFEQFRRAMDKRQNTLLDSVEGIYEDKKDLIVDIEQKLFQHGKKRKGSAGSAANAGHDFDPNIVLVLNRSKIEAHIGKYGRIVGAASTVEQVDADDSKTLSALEDSDEDDQVISVAAQKKKVLGEIQRNTMDKLDVVIRMEREAKTKAKQAAILTKEVDEALKYIAERTIVINEKIAVATPELAKAREAVAGINPKDINEIKTLKQPPKVIANVMTATVMILGHKIKEWRDVQKTLSYKFKPQLLGFDTYTLSKETRHKVYKKYAGKDDFTYDRVYEASKVCGNLVLWVLSQIKYSRMLDVIIPLEKEIKKLKRESRKKEKLAKELLKVVKQLEDNIQLYTAQCNEMIEHIIKSTDHELKQFSDKLQPLNEKFNALLNNKVLD